MTNAEIAKKILEFYGGDASKWAQGFAAFDENGRAALALDEKACKWCLYGAGIKVCGGDTEELYGLHRFFPEMDYSVGTWNDAPGRSFDEVVAKLKEIAGE